MYQRRAVGLVLAITSIVLCLAAVSTRSWWRLREGRDEVTVGLRKAELCAIDHGRRYYDETARDHRRCAVGSLRVFLRGDLDRRVQAPSPWDEEEARPARRPVPRTFVFLGTLVFVAGLGLAVAIAATAATSLGAGAAGRPLPTLTVITGGVFAALALAYVIAAPGPVAVMRAGAGLLLALAGAATGVAGALALGRADPAREPTGAQLAAAQRAAPFGRRPALIAGAIGAALVLASILTHAWFRGRAELTSVGAGVQEVEVCGRWADDRTTCSIDTIPADPAQSEQRTRTRVFLAAGTMTYWSGLAAALAFGLAALLALLRQAVGGLASLPRVVGVPAVVFAVSALAYLFAKPKEAAALGVSWGAFVALGGATALVGAAILFGRWVDAVALTPLPAPVAEPPPAPAPSFAAPPPDAATAAAPVPVTIPPCPACGTPMLWVSAKQAWLCTLCKTRPGA